MVFFEFIRLILVGFNETGRKVIKLWYGGIYGKN